MHLKFSLGGREWRYGEEVDHIYTRVIEEEIPACLIVAMWNDRDMKGSIDISLSQISCRFAMTEVDGDNYIAIQRAFMHEDYKSDEVVKMLHGEMIALRDKMETA